MTGKRKRDDFAPPSRAHSGSTQQKKAEIEERIVEGKKNLNKALKTAKGFEWQKLCKRIGHAQEASDSALITKLERELKQLKEMEMAALADAHTHKTLLKSKTIAESGLLPEYVVAPKRKEGLSDEEVVAYDNVTARLYNTKGVKENIQHLMRGIYAVTGQPEKKPQQQQKEEEKPSKKAKVEEKPVKEKKVREVVEKKEKKEKRKEVEEGVEPAWDGFDSGSDDEDEGSDVEIDFDKFEGRLGGDSADEESESEFEIPKQHNKVVEGKKIMSRGISVSVSGSDAEDDEEDVEMEDYSLSSGSDNDEEEEDEDDESESDSDNAVEVDRAPAPKPKKEKVAREAPKPLKAGSQFLPTLMGGYWSGEEEASDIEEELKPVVRKNRPGQQARRAIWEKKYGAAANHVKNAPKESRDDGWDAKRGAKGADDRGARGGRGGRGGRGVPGAFGRDRSRVTGENTAPLGVKREMKRDDVGVLHPSWQAAKKAKEEKKTAKFEGKKVVFD